MWTPRSQRRNVSRCTLLPSISLVSREVAVPKLELALDRSTCASATGRSVKTCGASGAFFTCKCSTAKSTALSLPAATFRRPSASNVGLTSTVRTVGAVVEMGVQPRLAKDCTLAVESRRRSSSPEFAPIARRLTVSEAATTMSPGSSVKSKVNAVRRLPVSLSKSASAGVASMACTCASHAGSTAAASPVPPVLAC